MIRDFPIVTIEDAFDEDDWPNWSEFVSKVGGPVQVHRHARNESVVTVSPRKRGRASLTPLSCMWSAIESVGSSQVVGDDLTVTNPTKIARAVKEKAANALLLKVGPLSSGY